MTRRLESFLLHQDVLCCPATSKAKGSQMSPSTTSDALTAGGFGLSSASVKRPMSAGAVENVKRPTSAGSCSSSAAVQSARDRRPRSAGYERFQRGSSTAVGNLLSARLKQHAVGAVPLPPGLSSQRDRSSRRRTPSPRLKRRLSQLRTKSPVKKSATPNPDAEVHPLLADNSPRGEAGDPIEQKSWFQELRTSGLRIKTEVVERLQKLPEHEARFIVQSALGVHSLGAAECDICAILEAATQSSQPSVGSIAIRPPSATRTGVKCYSVVQKSHEEESQQRSQKEKIRDIFRVVASDTRKQRRALTASNMVAFMNLRKGLEEIAEVTDWVDAVESMQPGVDVYELSHSAKVPDVMPKRKEQRPASARSHCTPSRLDTVTKIMANLEAREAGDPVIGILAGNDRCWEYLRERHSDVDRHFKRQDFTSRQTSPS